jgi:membrane protein DedA with SNARE-associated domain
MEQLITWVSINQLAVYALLFGYCALKSGALPFLAGVLVNTGSLDLAPVLLASFLGGYLGDEARFAIARRYGDRLFVSRPKWRAYIDRAADVSERYGAAYVFLYRYPKGMRTIGALPLGLSNIEWNRFTVLNGFSAALWSCLLVGFGVMLGDQIALAAETGWGAVSAGLLILFLVAAWLAFRRFAKAELSPDQAS